MAAQRGAPKLTASTIASLPPELASNPQYQVLRELGRGGMGVVYLAKNKLMDRLEVLKVVNKDLLDRPSAVERFLREIRSAARLNHANIVAAYSAVHSGELLALAMEYVEGEDLAQLVQRQGPLPVVHACYYVQQAALGLQHAFEKQMVHRDIKPQNLILAREGKRHVVKILDFGLAKVTRGENEDTGLTGSRAMMGTPDYIAPEQTLDAASADIRADIYSLGCTLYYLLTGTPPFTARSLYEILQAHQSKEAMPLNVVRAEVPAELAAVVRKMMAKEPAERYQTPMALVQALAPFVKPGAKGAADGSGTIPLAPQREAAPVVAADTITTSSTKSVGPRKARTGRKRRPPEEIPSEETPSSKRNWLIGGVTLGILCCILVCIVIVIRSRANAEQEETTTETTAFTNSLGMEFVLVPKGKSWLGGGGGRPGDLEIASANDFYLGKYEVTQEEWMKVTGLTPSFFSRTGGGQDMVREFSDAALNRFPVENVTWDDAQRFLERLNREDQEDGWVYRLPTAAEWEYACRGGPLSDKRESAHTYYLDKPTNDLHPEHANYGRVLGRTSKVGSYPPNRLGLYDMHGNVWEWLNEPEGTINGVRSRVSRGGCWSTDPRGCTAAFRGRPAQWEGRMGLRVARVPKE